ncbi:MAG TPA: tetratricopeptide repeat protein [Casimicrobiaceae bacterium]|nr:tetratricopeptide repeat protein [Casimicrobiaceae bacterium]
MTTSLLLQQAQSALAAGRDGEALDLLRRASVQDPRNPEALFHLGNLLALRREFASAIMMYERALQFAPAHPELVVNLGVAHGHVGDTAKAEARYREVLRRHPSHARALGNFAQSLFQREDFQGARELYDRLLSVMPQAGADVWNKCGICQQRLGDRVAAEQSFRRALALAPNAAEINANLALLLYDSRRYGAARELLHRAHALDPRRLLVAAQALVADLQFCDWHDFERRRDAMVAAVSSLASEPRQSVPPYLLLAICDDPVLQSAAAKHWAWPVASAAPGASSPRRFRAAGTPLRIGFVSSALHEHPVPRLIVELLERLDRGRFDVRGYANGRGKTDALRARIERAVTAIVELGHLPTAAAVDRVRADGIDILFDLTGHTGQARPDLFAARPAPVQVNFLGYAGTLGGSYYDFIITDDYTTPPGAQAHFSERLCAVGECYLPSDTRREIAPRNLDRAEYGLAGDAFVFASQAASYKILPDLFNVWMRLLRSLPDAILWLRPAEETTQKNLRAEADRRGVDPRRLVFAPSEPLPRYLARYALADLYLDTYPFGSHTTVNDALFSGIPVLTIAGRSMAARASGAQLRAAGLPELIAASAAEYETIALALARDRQHLRTLKAHLARDGHAIPLFDMEGYVRAFEAAIDRMWAEA